MTLQAHQLGIRMGGRWIIRDLTLELKPGRVCAVLGGNGAGKTTLQRALTGELPPHVGQVLLDGRPPAAWPTRELARKRAVMTQHDSLRFPFSVMEVVALAHLPWGDVRSGHENQIVMQALQAAHADAFAQRIYTELSGGERARVRFARALAQVWGQAGAFLLLDEPLAHLDFAYRYRCLAEARRQAQRGLGVVAILHDPNLAASYADDVVLMQEGRLVGFGPVKEWLTAQRLSAIYDCRITQGQDANGQVFFGMQAEDATSVPI